MHRLIAAALSATLLAGCADRTERPFAFRGLAPGMSYETFEAAAAATGSTLECRPLAVDPVPAGRLCHSPDSATSMVRIAGTVEGGSVPYVVVREAFTSPAAYDRLSREWGAPDTAIGTARRWTSGRWMANADTAADILTVWLSDTLTEARMAIASARQLWIRSGADTLPFFNDETAAIDSLRSDSAGRPAPQLANTLSGKPSVVSCNQSPAPDRLAGVTGAVILAYVVDTNGLVEPANVRVLQASHAGFVGSAIATIRSCSLRPGRSGTRAVRTIVTQRVSFRPAAAR